MKFRVGKNGKKWKVYCVINNTKYTVGSYDFNRKTQANADCELFKKKPREEIFKILKIEDPETKDVNKIEFKFAFKKYYASVANNKEILESTRERYISLLQLHIQPYISKTYISDYLYIDFKGAVDDKGNSTDTYNQVIKSLPAKWVKVDNEWLLKRIKKYDDDGKLITIDKKTIKDVVAEFKKFITFCANNDWKIDTRILAYRHSNLQKAEKEEWVPKSNDVFNLIKLEKNLCHKALWHGGAETGCSLSEILGWCYDDKFFDEELSSEVIFVRNSLGSKSEFRPGALKNGGRKRKVEISNELSKLLDDWMDTQKLPQTHARKYRRIFPYTKSHAADILKRATKKIGIEWRGAFSGFRKFSSSAADQANVLTDEQFLRRYGWKSKKTFAGHYRRDLNENKDERKGLINNLVRVN